MEHSDFASLSNSIPPSGVSPPLQALWWLKKGELAIGPDWERAHAICQQDEGNPDYDIVHALAHWIEGDEANAAYWYRRVGGQRGATIGAEWERVVGLLLTKV